MRGHQSDPSTWTPQQWAAFNDYVEQRSSSAHGLNSTTSEAGNGYTSGYNSAAGTVEGRS